MKLPQFSLRDLFWLVLVTAMGCAWWIERIERQGLIARAKAADERYEVARDSVQQTAELLRLTVVEKDGQVKTLRGSLFVNCPACGATMYVIENPTRAKIATREKSNGAEGGYCWQKTSFCRSCKGRFVFVVMPEDAPGYMTWTPVADEP